jgi:hypothetical protein
MVDGSAADRLKQMTNAAPPARLFFMGSVQWCTIAHRNLSSFSTTPQERHLIKKWSNRSAPAVVH